MNIFLKAILGFVWGFGSSELIISYCGISGPTIMLALIVAVLGGGVIGFVIPTKYSY